MQSGSLSKMDTSNPAPQRRDDLSLTQASASTSLSSIHLLTRRSSQSITSLRPHHQRRTKPASLTSAASLIERTRQRDWADLSAQGPPCATAMPISRFRQSGPRSSMPFVDIDMVVSKKWVCRRGGTLPSRFATRMTDRKARDEHMMMQLQKRTRETYGRGCSCYACSTGLSLLP